MTEIYSVLAFVVFGTKTRNWQQAHSAQSNALPKVSLIIFQLLFTTGELMFHLKI